jgi:hypothetical protein
MRRAPFELAPLVGHVTEGGGQPALVGGERNVTILHVIDDEPSHGFHHACEHR